MKIRADQQVEFYTNIDANTNKIINVVDPTNPQDAATKAYADSHGGGSSTLSGLTDVTIPSPLNDQSLVYQTSDNKWHAITISGGTGSDDHLTIVDTGDTPGNLNHKLVAGNNIGLSNIGTTDKQIVITASGGSDDHLVIVDTGDTPGNLSHKLVAGNNIGISQIGTTDKQIVIVASGGGTGSAIYSSWDADAPPVVAGALDDEFNDGVLYSGWLKLDPASKLTASEGSYGLQVSVATNATDNTTGYYKTIPAGNFTIWTKIDLNTITANYMSIGLALFENGGDSSKKIVVFTLSQDNTPQFTIQIQNYSAYNTWNANVIQIVDKQEKHPIYLRIRRTGTTYEFDYSGDGIGWHRIYSTASLYCTPVHFGIVANNNNTGVTTGGRFQFFRYLNSYLSWTNPGAGRAIGKGNDGVALTGYTKADGTVPFTGTIAGITPVSSSDLATKNYVDTHGLMDILMIQVFN